MAQSNDYKSAKKVDTVFWCEQIRTYSGLSDKEIEERLFPKKDYEEVSIRNFNRWANGQRAMTPDALQSMVKKARQYGLLAERLYGPGLSSSYEERLNLNPGEGRASEKLKFRAKSVSALHKARKNAVEALNNYAEALKNASHLLVFDTCNLEDGSPVEVYPQDLQKMAKTVDSHRFHCLG